MRHTHCEASRIMATLTTNVPHLLNLLSNACTYSHQLPALANGKFKLTGNSSTESLTDLKTTLWKYAWNCVVKTRSIKINTFLLLNSFKAGSYYFYMYISKVFAALFRYIYYPLKNGLVYLVFFPKPAPIF